MSTADTPIRVPGGRHRAAAGSMAARPGDATSEATFPTPARASARECARRGILALPGAPRPIATAMPAALAGHRARIAAEVPAGRGAQPGDIAQVAGFLFSPGAGYMTGPVPPMEGGSPAALAAHR